MGDCPVCGYWVKKCIYGSFLPGTAKPIAVFQCPNGHTWHEETRNIGDVAIGGTTYNVEALRAYTKEKLRIPGGKA